MIQISQFSFENPRFLNLLGRRGGIPKEVELTVKEILQNVRKNGDRALHAYMKKYDGADIDKIGLLVSEEEFENARKKVSEPFKEAVRAACDNLLCFHRKQLPEGYQECGEDGVILERRYVPINSAAVMVPGSMAPLVSTLCMNLIPAIVAGVPNLCILTKPGKNGTIDEHLLYTADYLGVRNYYKISGAQGLAAVAYGTETVKRVDAILGPGNNYTQMAVPPILLPTCCPRQNTVPALRPPPPSARPWSRHGVSGTSLSACPENTGFPALQPRPWKITAISLSLNRRRRPWRL